MSIPEDGLNGLPTELLCNVLRQAIGLLNPKEDRCRLMLVCRRWRELVERSPLLWTDIWSTDGIPYIRRVLEKSGEAMIDILCTLHTSSFAELEAFLAEIGPHIARWRMLVLAAFTPPPESALALLTTEQAPCLETLKLMVPSVDLGSESAITLFGGAPAPSTLRVLALSTIPVAFEPLRLSDLKWLHLVAVPTISTPQLLEILRRSPRLEQLELVHNSGLIAIRSQASNIQPIELPKLAHLSFKEIHSGGTHFILSNIRIPNNRRLSIRGNIRGASARSVLFTSAITHILHTTIPTTDVPTSAIRVHECYGYRCIITFRGISLELELDGKDQVQEILRWFADGLGSEAAECPVHLKLDTSETDSVCLVAVPHPLVIKHLSFSDTTPESLRKVLYTAMALPPHPPSGGWLFARLESLSVGFLRIESQKVFVSMLRSRYQGATSTGDTESIRPMNLRSVELRGVTKDEGLVEEIRGILPEADVYWAD